MSKLKATSLSTGLAMFSMFFGAGNITFPLMIGKSVKEGIVMALIGLILTAVVIPFTGMVSMTLFKGDYRSFFSRIGKIPGLIVILILLGIIGPFGGIPRLVTLTFSTISVYFPHLNLLTFSCISCLLIFLFSWKRSRILNVIGYILSPLLILSLLFIIIKGIFFSSPQSHEVSSIATPFLYGLKEGYNTMDLIAAFFFSSLVYGKLKQQSEETKGQAISFFAVIFKASVIGALLLSLVYIGFGYVAANYSKSLANTPIDQLLGQIGHIVLGKHAGLIVCLSVVLTCLTTAIALTVICADFLQQQFFKKLRYEYALILILGVTGWVSSIEFTGIVRMLAPVLQVIYPSLLVLCLFNILHKTFAIRPIKVPVFLAMFLVVYFQYVV